MSTNTQIREWLASHPGFHTPREIAQALGLEAKAVSSAVSKLVKTDRLVREDGKVADPSLVEAADNEDEAEAHAEQIRDEKAIYEDDLFGDIPPTSSDYPKTPEKQFDLAAMKTKISKLLAKAEGTDNEHERDTFNAQAEKLMLKLGVQRAELEAAGEVKAEDIIEAVREWHGNYSIVMVPFVYNVAQGFGNLTVLQQNVSTMLRRTFVIGHKTDVKEFLTLLDSLALQVLSALRRWQKENKEARRDLTDMEKYVQHRSFIHGFGLTVMDRLKAERRDEEKDASTGAALVLASKMDRITGWVSDTYGELDKARGGMRYGSSSATRDGQAAGRFANLGGKSVDGAKGEIK